MFGKYLQVVLKRRSILQALKREIKEETNLDILYVEKFVSAVDYLANEAKCLQINFNVRCSGNGN